LKTLDTPKTILKTGKKDENGLRIVDKLNEMRNEIETERKPLNSKLDTRGSVKEEEVLIGKIVQNEYESKLKQESKIHGSRRSSDYEVVYCMKNKIFYKYYTIIHKYSHHRSNICHYNRYSQKRSGGTSSSHHTSLNHVFGLTMEEKFKRLD
jgi:hypothetical protein